MAENGCTVCVVRSLPTPEVRSSILVIYRAALLKINCFEKVTKKEKEARPIRLPKFKFFSIIVISGSYSNRISIQFKSFSFVVA